MSRPITRRDALAVLAGSAVSLRFGSAAGQRTSSQEGKKRPPNFVVFMTDDQRQDAMSVAGNRILQTPNMDRIAREGVRFKESFVTNSLCGPSRASSLTGLYSHAHGYISRRAPRSAGARSAAARANGGAPARARGRRPAGPASGRGDLRHPRLGFRAGSSATAFRRRGALVSSKR